MKKVQKSSKIDEKDETELKVRDSQKDNYILDFCSQLLSPSILLNEEASILYANDAFCSELQYQLIEIKNQLLSELIYEISDIHISLKDNNFSSLDLKNIILKHKNTSLVSSDIKISRHKINDNSIYLAQFCINKSFEANFSVFQNLSIPAAIFDLTKIKFVKVNKSFEVFFSYTEKESIGKSPKQLGIFTNELQKECLKEIFAKKKSIDNELIEVKNKNGQKFTGMFSFKIIEDKNNFYGLATFQDYSYFFELERKLNETQSIAKMGRWELDLVHDRLEWSDGIYEIFEIDKRIFGASYESFLSLIHPDDRDRVNTAYLDSLKNKTSYSIFHRLLMPDGRIKFVIEICRTEYNELGIALKSVGIVQDITELKSTEEALNQFKRAVEQSPVSIFFTDNDGKIIYTNPKFTQLTGYSFDEVKHQNPRMFKSGDKDVFEYKNLWQTIKSGNVWEGEFKNVKKNGQIFWASASISPILDENGHLTHFVAIEQDVTEIKLIQEKLGDINANLEAILNSSDQAFSLFDLNNRLKLMNKKAEDDLSYLFGKKVDINASYQEFVPDYAQESFLSNIEKVKKGQSVYTERSFNSLSAGQDLVHYSFHYYPVYDTNNELIAICLNTRNISQQKYTQQKFEESRQNALNIIEKAPLPMIISKTNGVIIDCNLKALSLFELRREQLLNFSLMDVFVDTNFRVQVFKKFMQNGAIENEEIEILLKSGKKIWILASAVMIEYYGESAILFMAKDISDRKIIELELKDSTEQLEESLDNASKLVKELERSEEQLKLALHTKNKFFSIISHDLRGPFSGFLGLSDMIAKDFDELSVNDLKKMGKAINASAKSVYNLLESLLQWSRSQDGNMPFEPAFLNLKLANDIVKESLSGIAQSKKISIIDECSNEVMVRADMNMLTTILRNLVSNAIKFSHQNSKIVIKCKDFENKFIKISVCDEGVGMSEESSKKLFNLNYTFTSKGTNNEKGSGLGLILCKEFVDKHGGKIWVESQLGSGTSISFTIPKAY